MPPSGTSAAPRDESDLEALAQSIRGSFQTVEEMTVSFIREAVKRAIFKPGERLPQDRIAAILDISRMPVRASLRILEAEGLVSFHPHRGATVKVLEPEQIAEIYELRMLLEGHVLELAMERMTPEVFDELEELATRVDSHRTADDWLSDRGTFYESIYSLSNRPQTVELIMKLRAQLGRYLLLQRIVEEPHGHYGLLEHLRENDVKGAKKWLREHLQTVSEGLQRLVEQEAVPT